MNELDNITAVETERVSELSCSRCQSLLDVSEFEPFMEIDCPACSNKLTVPARLGAFQLVRLLGQGGMGAIYQGMDDGLGREVAIKVMLKSLGNDEALVETFRREARMAAALNHPNVVQIYSCGQEKGQPYIVMELVSGKTLEDIMSHTGPMLDALAIEVGLDVAKGLSAGCDVGLVHGDIKPKNILIDMKGTAKVVDFGLATFVDKQASDQGGIWGTPYYIPPEKVLKQPVDARSDMYSLGATLYHAIAGTPPFHGKTPIDVVKARLKGPPRPLSYVRRDVLPKTNDIIMRMLEEKPAKRYPNYMSLLGDLEEALQAAERSAGGPTLLAAKNAMLKRSAATKTVKHQVPAGLSLPKDAKLKSSSGPIPVQASSATPPGPATRRPRFGLPQQTQGKAAVAPQAAQASPSRVLMNPVSRQPKAGTPASSLNSAVVAPAKPNASQAQPRSSRIQMTSITSRRKTEASGVQPGAATEPGGASPNAAQPQGQPGKVLINLKSRSQRPGHVVPAETEEEIADRRKKQQATSKRNLLIVMGVLFVALLGALVTTIAFWRVDAQKKRAQVAEVEIQVNEVCESFKEQASKLAASIRRASSALNETHSTYKAGGRPKAAAKVDEAIKLYDGAVSKAGELEAIVAKATAAQAAVRQSSDVAFAAKTLDALKTFPPRVQQLTEEIRKLQRDAGEFVEDASTEEEEAPQSDKKPEETGTSMRRQIEASRNSDRGGL